MSVRDGDEDFEGPTTVTVAIEVVLTRREVGAGDGSEKDTAAADGADGADGVDGAGEGRGGAGACRVVDLGCGKGDFTLLLAAALGARVSVLGVDTNAAAVDAARERAAAAGLRNVRFVTADAAALLEARAPPSAGARDGDAPLSAPERAAGLGWTAGWHAGRRAELLVALHACGGLSDVALHAAAACGASCLVATCCFGKHRALRQRAPVRAWPLSGAGDEAVLCRMADCVEPRHHAEARTVVSNLRLERLRESLRAGVALTHAAIRTFDARYSRQNFVLAAACAECEEVR